MTVVLQGLPVSLEGLLSLDCSFSKLQELLSLIISLLNEQGASLQELRKDADAARGRLDTVHADSRSQTESIDGLATHAADLKRQAQEQAAQGAAHKAQLDALERAVASLPAEAQRKGEEAHRLSTVRQEALESRLAALEASEADAVALAAAREASVRAAATVAGELEAKELENMAQRLAALEAAVLELRRKPAWPAEPSPRLPTAASAQLPAAPTETLLPSTPWPAASLPGTLAPLPGTLAPLPGALAPMRDTLAPAAAAPDAARMEALEADVRGTDAVLQGVEARLAALEAATAPRPGSGGSKGAWSAASTTVSGPAVSAMTTGVGTLSQRASPPLLEAGGGLGETDAKGRRHAPSSARAGLREQQVEARISALEARMEAPWPAPEASSTGSATAPAVPAGLEERLGRLQASLAALESQCEDDLAFKRRLGSQVEELQSGLRRELATLREEMRGQRSRSELLQEEALKLRERQEAGAEEFAALQQRQESTEEELRGAKERHGIDVHRLTREAKELRAFLNAMEKSGASATARCLSCFSARYQEQNKIMMGVDGKVYKRRPTTPTCRGAERVPVGRSSPLPCVPTEGRRSRERARRPVSAAQDRVVEGDTTSLGQGGSVSDISRQGEVTDDLP